ncbi:MAG: oligosaccharide flippase family protein [Chitinophagaceae bacterium]|jgi:O-antigen/teichoic acid export membrane protein
MGIVFRQSIKTTIITFFGAALGGVLLIVSTNVMEKQDLGFVRNLPNQAVVASFFLIAGMSNTLFFYLHRFDEGENKEKKSVLMSLCFLVPLCIYLLMAACYFLFKDYWLNHYQIQDVAIMKQYFICFPLFAFFNLTMMMLEAFLNAHTKSAQISFVREIFIKGLNLLLFILFGFGLLSFGIFVYSFVCVNLLSVLLLFFLARKINDFRFSLNWSLLSQTEYRAIFMFAGFHALMGISGTLMGFLDGQLLAIYDKSGLASVSIYTSAVFIATLISIPSRAMTAPASADISRAYAQNLHEKVKDSYSRSGLNIFIASVFMCVLISCNLHNALAIMPVGYEAVFGVTLIMLIGRLVDSGTGLNDLALNMSPHYKVNFYLSVGFVVLMIVLFRIMIPPFGVYGAAWVFSITVALFNAAKTYFVWKKMNLHPFSKGTLTTLFIGVSVMAMVFFLPKFPNPYIDAVLRSGLIAFLFIGLVFWLKPSKDISHYVNETLKKKKLF